MNSIILREEVRKREKGRKEERKGGHEKGKREMNDALKKKRMDEYS